MNEHPHFDGETYDPGKDFARLKGQQARLDWLARRDVADPRWYTLEALSELVGGSEASVSARLRDFRKDKFQERYGIWIVDRRRVKGQPGLWEYRMRRPPAPPSTIRGSQLPLIPPDPSDAPEASVRRASSGRPTAGPSRRSLSAACAARGEHRVRA